MRKILSVDREGPEKLTAIDEYATLMTEGAYFVATRRNEMFFAGYRTYIVAVSLVGLGVAKWFGVEVPEEVWMMLGGLGLGSLRAAVDEKKA